jgi:hypothetical protein
LGAPRLRASTVTVAGLWLLLLAALANRPPQLYDAGLYHLQTIQWIRAAPAPLGLANLHARFGYNSAWFPLAAVLQLPVWSTAAGFAPNLLSPLLIWFYGLAGLGAARRLIAGGWSRHDLFLCGSLAVLGGELFTYQVTSLPPDLPIFILALACTALCLRWSEGGLAAPVAVAALALLAAFGLAIKLSAVPLTLFPLALWARAGLARQAPPWQPLAALVGGVGLVLFVPWVARGLLLSGCPAFPSTVLCAPGLEWRVPVARVEAEAREIMAWGRLPDVPTETVLRDWTWLGPWWDRVRVQGLVPAALKLHALALAALALAGRRPLRGDSARAGWAWALVPLLAGVAYWFFSAPEFRFGAGYWWGSGLLLLAAGLFRLRDRIAPRARRRFQQIATVALISAFGVWLALPAAVTAAYFIQAGPAQFWLQWPPVPTPPLVRQGTSSGQAVYQPATGVQCWLAPLPCTPDLPHGLVIRDLEPGSRPAFIVP